MQKRRQRTCCWPMAKGREGLDNSMLSPELACGPRLLFSSEATAQTRPVPEQSMPPAGCLLVSDLGAATVKQMSAITNLGSVRTVGNHRSQTDCIRFSTTNQSSSAASQVSVVICPFGRPVEAATDHIAEVQGLPSS